MKIRKSYLLLGSPLFCIVLFFHMDADRALVYNLVLDGINLEFERVVDDEGTALIRDRKTGLLFLP